MPRLALKLDETTFYRVYEVGVQKWKELSQWCGVDWRRKSGVQAIEASVVAANKGVVSLNYGDFLVRTPDNRVYHYGRDEFRKQFVVDISYCWSQQDRSNPRGRRWVREDNEMPRNVFWQEKKKHYVDSKGSRPKESKGHRDPEESAHLNQTNRHTYGWKLCDEESTD